ncbi:hypothetical protein PR002_g15025 [Phytophthora rubi]|uniref:Uncharacterized protein n=1 Tax=Phytophthora rubi TaxID=129364 RepID=A0A6A3KXN9_9STRA|nr:hypothetical protein PR002_g15025 [Phytophthora rubi]
MMSCPTARRHPSAAPSSASLGALVNLSGGSTQLSSALGASSALGESTPIGCVGHSCALLLLPPLGQSS